LEKSSLDTTIRPLTLNAFLYMRQCIPWRGQVHINCRIGNEKVSFTTLKRRFDDPLKATIEAGYNSGMMYELLEEVGTDASVAHPLKVRAIADA